GVEADHWCRQLAASPLVDAQAAEQGERPLVLQGRRLYLRRYWRYERQVASILRQRLATRLPLPQGLPEQLQRLFAESTQQPDWQRLACALAARGAFSIITGGPGTGKTTTVVRRLALLQAGDRRVDVAVPGQPPPQATPLHRLLGSVPDARQFRHHAGNPLLLDVLVVDEASTIDLEMMACLLDALPPRARLILLGDKD